MKKTYKKFHEIQLLFFFIVTIFVSMESKPSELTLQLRPTLTLEIAQKIAQACELKQGENKRVPVTIAIFDGGANLVLFHRMTGASLGSVTVAMEKGRSAANFPVATGQWGDYTFGEQGSPGIAFLPNIITIPGGVPIVTPNGDHIGGVGVSGSSGGDDEACALAGLTAVKQHLITVP